MTPGLRQLPVRPLPVRPLPVRRVIVLGWALGWVLGGCGPSQTGSISPASPTSTARPPTPSIGIETVPVGTQTPAPATGTAVVIDPSLLDILPATVDGLPIAENRDGEAAALGDPLLPRVASAMAAGFALEPASGDFVYAVVVRLRPDAMDAAAFRDWRDSYDEGACEQASGVAGRAQTDVGGRTVYIGTCTGGLRTYHVWLVGPGMLISASAIGERRLGELLVENLRP